MPTNCCVPLCTKKDKRDKETGEKISFFRFPEEENIKKQMDSCYKERCWTKFFNKRGNPSLFEAFQGGRFAEKSQWKS